MRYVSILLLLMSFNSIADDKSDLYFKLNNKMNYCNSLADREIKITKDAYFDSLNKKQKIAIIRVLYNLANDRCYAYEEAQYLKAVIIVKNVEEIDALSGLYNIVKNTEETTEIIKSLDAKEIERLSSTETFNVPFHLMDLTDKLGLY